MYPPPLQTFPQLSLFGCSPFSWTFQRKISLQFSSPSFIVYYITLSNKITEFSDNRCSSAVSFALRVPRRGKRKRAYSKCWRNQGQDTSACVNPADQHVTWVEGKRTSDSGISNGRKGCCNREGCRFSVSFLPTPRSTSSHSCRRYTHEETTTAS